MTAVRLTTGDSRRTIWTRQDGEYALTDAAVTEHARLPDIATASKDRFPAVYSYDRATGDYTVHEAGETHHYESKAAFRENWVKVKQPFVPEHELSVPDYARESYAIVILGGDGEDGDRQLETARLYERGETTPLSTILDSPPSLSAESEDSTEADVPTRVLPEEPESATETRSGDNVVFEDEDSFLRAFVDARLSAVEGNYLPVAEAYAAYSSAAAEHDIPVRNKSWFSKKLGEHIEIERARKRIDGTLTRCYVGIELVEPGEEL
ncbi:hypothetical protein ACFQE8_22470 [Salinirubellus sp. GCM10025818]|uniref:hypothetical protein n=1 Tax=Salinirubellus TaxID=2162630 RepID=UPI0030CEE986